MWFAWHHGFWGIAAAVIPGIALAVVALRFGAWRGKSRRWWMAGCILPLLAAFMVCMAMADVEVELKRQAPVVIFLDLSPSTRGSLWRNPEFVRQLAAKRLGAMRAVTVEGFGGDGMLRRVLLRDITPQNKAAWPARWSPEILDALAGAPLTDPDLAESATPPVPRKDAAARWIITDGLFSSRTAFSPDATRIPDAWTLLPPTTVDIAIQNLRVTATGGGGELLAQIRAVGPPSASGETAARVLFFRDGRQIASQTLTFHSPEAQASLDSARWISLHDTLNPADRARPHRYAALARLLGPDDSETGDLWPENDRGEIGLPGAAGAGSRVLFVGNTPPPNLPDAWQFTPADRFFGDVRRWTAEGRQAIVLDDVPAEAMDGRQTISVNAAHALRQFVEDTGGGLILLGDGHAFGPGHYGETGEGSAGNILEELSPVSSHFHTGPKRVLYVLDASASMNEAAPDEIGGSAQGTGGEGGNAATKFALLSRAVERSAGWLNPDDLITLITFNGEAHQIFSGHAGPADQRASRLESALSTVRPSGSTVPDTALSLTRQALQYDAGTSSDIQANRPLVILVTDGEIPALDVAGWAGVLQTSRANLFIVAPPPASADAPLRRLSEILSRDATDQWSAADDPAEWTHILSHLMAGQFRGTQEHLPRHYVVSAGNGQKLTDTPDRMTRVWPKPGTEVLIRGDAAAGGAAPGPALFSWAQRGLGRVGAVTVPDDHSPAYQEAFEELLKKVAANPGDRRFQLNAARTAGGLWMLTADGADPRAATATTSGFIDGASLAAHPLGDEAASQIPLRQTAPGRYQARISAPGGLAAIVTCKDANGTQQLVGRLITADVQTTEWPASVLPRRIPAGLILPASRDDAATWNPTLQSAWPLATVFWLGAIAAALAALFLRRAA